MTQIRTERTRSNNFGSTVKSTQVTVDNVIQKPTAALGISNGNSAEDLRSKEIANPDPADVTKEKVRSSDKPGKLRPARESDVANNLLTLEREARRAKTQAELGYLIVNGSRVAVQYRQGILLMRRGPAKHRVVAVSSLSAVDRTSTFVRWVERNAQAKLAGANYDKVITFDAQKEADEDDPDAKNYPFSQVAYIPLQLRDGTVFAHVMFTRDVDWDEASLVAAARVCETYSHSWEALTGPAKAKRKLRSKTFFGIGAAVGALLLGMLPVPLTVLAPAEVTAADPFVVAAPIDGVVDSINVEPNSFVSEGAQLFKYSDTDLRNKVKLAGQAVSVAEARYTQSVRTSFADSKAKRELSIAKSELQLKAGEYDYAKELLDKSVVTAPKGGLVIFADKDTWTGRPVSTGERIMRIADPEKVRITVNLPVSDAISLVEGTRVKLYLDSDPLLPVEANLRSSSFHATPDAAGNLSYRVEATFAEDEKTPRIGLRGTAQLYGDDVTLLYYLFRKPLSAIRQWTGL